MGIPCRFDHTASTTGTSAGPGRRLHPPLHPGDGDGRDTGIQVLPDHPQGRAGGEGAYDPAAARERAETHAGNFFFNRAKQLEFLSASFRDGPPPIVISPYDAELYGPLVVRGPDLPRPPDPQAGKPDVLRLQSPIDYLAGIRAAARPAPMSSWRRRYAGVWLDEGTTGVYRYLQQASEADDSELRSRPS